MIHSALKTMLAVLLLIFVTATLPAQNWSTIADIVPQTIGESLTNTTTRITFTNATPQGFFKVRYKREGR